MTLNQLILASFLCLFYFCANAKNIISTPNVSVNNAQHPFLLTTPARISYLRSAIKSKSWHAQNWLRLKEKADKILLENVDLPTRAGNWEQYYIDTVTGVNLDRGKLIGDWQWEHRGHTTGHLFRSNVNRPNQDYDGVVIGLIHNAWALSIVELGLAYQISRNPRYAYKAREILLAYATLYPKLPITNRSKGRNPKDTDFGKIQVQTLDEAIWLIDVVQGTDLIWNYLSVNERKTIQNQLLIPSAHLITQTNQPTANIVCWENAAMGLVGLLSKDESMIREALYDSTKGYIHQVQHSITSEGFWIERSSGYHFYALHALITLGQAATNAGYSVDLKPLQKMLDAPLQLTSYELTIPAFNDSHTTQLRDQRYLYEWGYKQFNNSDYGVVLREQKRDKPENKGPFFLDWALIYGEASVPPVKFPVSQSINLPVTGYSLLSKGKEHFSTLLYLKYSPYTGGHSHRDQLSFVLVKNGEQIAIDPGINTYGDPAHWGWYQNSASHNTFLFNQLAQRASEAQCLAFGKSNNSEYVILDTRNAYDSIRFVRTATLITENLVLFVDQYQVHRPARDITIAYHQSGHWLNHPQAITYPNPVTGSGFAWLNNRQIIHQQRGLSLLGQLPSGRQVRVCTDATTPTDMITANDPSLINGDVSSVFFRRPISNSGMLVWCLALDGQLIDIEVKEISKSLLRNYKVPALQIQLRNSRGKQWQVMVNPDKQYIDAFSDRYNSNDCFYAKEIK